MKKRLSFIAIFWGVLCISCTHADFMNIGPLDFRSLNTSNGPFPWIDGCRIWTTDGSTTNFQAKLPFSDGDAVNSVAFIGSNLSGANAAIRATLYRWHFDGSSDSIYAESTINEGWFNKQMAGTISLPFTVDLEHYTYGLILTFNNSPHNSDLGAQAVILNITPSSSAVMPALSLTSIVLLTFALSLFMILRKKR